MHGLTPETNVHQGGPGFGRAAPAALKVPRHPSPAPAPAVIALVALSGTLYYCSTHIMADAPFTCCALAVLREGPVVAHLATAATGMGGWLRHQDSQPLFTLTP